jgi:hypothetical protein
VGMWIFVILRVMLEGSLGIQFVRDVASNVCTDIFDAIL